MLKSSKETTVCLKDISVSRCIDYGYVFVLLHMMRQLRIDQVLEKVLPPSDANIVKAMLIGKIITGGSKLCIYNWLCRESFISELLGLNMSECRVDDLYSSLGKLYLHQSPIEKKWFRYHKGSQRRVYLYDITSSYFEGTHNALAAYGYNRDGKRGKMQLCVGLLTAEDGFPLRIQAFAGNTADSSTVCDQIRSLKKELGVEQIVFVGDRGMHIMYHLENDPELSDENIEFITGLTHAQIHTLIARGAIQLNLFDSDLAEVAVEGKRYILSVNPVLEKKELAGLDNRHQRAEALVENIRKTWERRCARNRENLCKQKENEGKYKQLKTELTSKDIDACQRRVYQALIDCSMEKYYTITGIDNQSFQVDFNQDEFNKSRSLCGKYVVCTNVPAKEMTAEQVRGEYKNLQKVEHAFRDLKSENISIRPIYHWRENQTRGHVLLCMFAYAIIKKLEDKLFPLLKQYNHSNSAQLSFNDLTAELSNIKMCELKIGQGLSTIQYPELNPLQKKIFDALNIDPKIMTQ
jgi:transposase